MSEPPGVRPWFVVRVYLYGVLMIALAAGASFLVGRYSLRPALDGPARPSSTWIAWHMTELADHPDLLKTQLEDLRTRVGIEMSVFDLNGHLLGTGAKPPPAPISAEELGHLQ